MFPFFRCLWRHRQTIATGTNKSEHKQATTVTTIAVVGSFDIFSEGEVTVVLFGDLVVVVVVVVPEGVVTVVLFGDLVIVVPGDGTYSQAHPPDPRLCGT